MTAKVNNSCKTSKGRGKNGFKNRRSLDTLAQLGTTNMYTHNNMDKIVVSPVTKKSNKTSLQKRARRKYFTNGIVLALVKAAENNDKSTLRTSYWRTYRCTSSVGVLEDGRVVADYCKNRWCMVCNAIRTANYINRYSSTLASWSNSHLVTLTIPNCKADDLKFTIDYMQKVFKNIMDAQKKKFQRGKTSFKLVGIRKLECTYNSVRNDYHPHFHVIVPEKVMGDVMLGEWLERIPAATRNAQDIRKADVGVSMELFKYMTKVIASSNTGKNIDRCIYAAPLDVIFNSMIRKRVVQPFGFRLPKEIEEETIEVTREMLVDVMHWQQDIADWVSYETGESLSGYEPCDAMRNLVENKIFVGSLLP